MGTHDTETSVARERLVDTLRAALGLPEQESPFPWQDILLRRFVEGEIPRALDIPTGLGKTAVMAIWLVARAASARVPRRLVYVVDRRAVVDQATTEAERLRAWVDRNSDVKKALGVAASLPTSTLRGQHVDNRLWLEDPSSPAVIVGTIDMIGSRLLFEGYGVSRKMRPYHAGLLGADSLIVLDEAHLVQPFERLIEQIATGRDASGRPLGPEDPALKKLVPPLRFLSLSATGRDRGEDDKVLRLTGADRQHEVVKKRLSAAKRLVLRAEVADKELPEALASEAWALSKEGTSPVRIIVFCTSRDHAQKVQEALKKRAPKLELIEAELFVGGRRVYEREEASRWLNARGFIAGSKAKPERATFVIATAAGEVGVDLDADHAVCDLVAWERMVQRFGRVNRRGDGEAEVIVVPASIGDENAKARRDAVRELFGALPKAGDTIDVSPGALTALKEKRELRSLVEQASTPAPLHPPLTRALVEAWSMTSLDEHTGRPEVAPWIRGWPDEEEEPQTTVVWRTHLPITSQGRLLGKRDLEAFRDAADPHLAERLETETWRVVEWLGKRLKALEALKPEDAELDRAERLRTTDVVAVILDARDGGDRVVSADDLSNREKRDAIDRALQEATLIVDRRVRGLRSGLLADEGDDEVVDVTEVEPNTDSAVASDRKRVVPFRIRRVVEGDVDGSPDGWRTEASVPVRKSDDGEIEWLLIESLAGQVAGSEEGRSGAKRDQLLDEHQTWAEDEAERMGERLGLSDEHAELLAVSARLHDEGKQAPCWQRAFHASNDGKPPYYAKTTKIPDLKVLGRYRHELGSLPHAEAHERVKALAPELRELCLHLIAAHHGSARPLIRTTGAPEPPTRLVERAQQIALRFAALEKRWGPWGLAWWEALLRAADQQASRRNDQEGGSRG